MTSAATGPAPAVDTATWPRRMLALLVDWAASTLVVVLFVGFEDYFEVGSNLQSWTLLVYVVEATVLTATVGGSFGQVATRCAWSPCRTAHPCPCCAAWCAT